MGYLLAGVVGILVGVYLIVFLKVDSRGSFVPLILGVSSFGRGLMLNPNEIFELAKDKI